MSMIKGMKRKIEEKLLSWKDSPTKKPLIIYGSRQVGKTTSIKEFGKTNYFNMVYIDFEAYPQYRQIFEGEISPKRIISELEKNFNSEIKENDTLIVLDEVQCCLRALTALKYFNEQAPSYHIIAAGSLLGNALIQEQSSFPVGQVETLTMYPMDFEEFLMGLGREDLIKEIKDCYKESKEMSPLVHNLLLDYYDTYLEVGGMPEAVKAYIETNEKEKVHDIQRRIILNYRNDMTHYANPSMSVKIEKIYDSIPTNLARSNKKYQFASLGEGTKKKTFDQPLGWLLASSTIYSCNRVKDVKYPLKVQEDDAGFKLYYNDVGLYLSLIGLNLDKISTNLLSPDLLGAITETYVMSQLVDLGFTPYYWESKGIAEIDFIIQKGETIIPLEVKAGDNVKSKSLQVYQKINTPKMALRVSRKNFGESNGIKAIPLYALFCLED